MNPGPTIILGTWHYPGLPDVTRGHPTPSDEFHTGWARPSVQSDYMGSTTTIVHNMRSKGSAQVAAYTAGTPDDRTWMQCAANDEVHRTNGVRDGLGRQQNSSLSNRTRRERKRTMTDQGRVEMKRKVAEKGVKTRRRVDEEAAAAPRGPGTVTTAKTTGGMSLATPFQPPRHESETTQPIRTLHDMGSSGEGRGVASSHREAAGDEVEGGETNDEVRRAHKRVDDEDSRVEMSEDKTTTATPHAPQSTPLKGEWIGQTSDHQSAKSASARSASRDHPDLDENVETRNSPRPPEDPGDATDDDVRHPDEPTEPPDDAESARVQGGEERVKADVSRGRADETAELGGSVAHENADADVDRVAREKR